MRRSPTTCRTVSCSGSSPPSRSPSRSGPRGPDSTPRSRSATSTSSCTRRRRRPSTPRSTRSCCSTRSTAIRRCSSRPARSGRCGSSSIRSSPAGPTVSSRWSATATVPTTCSRSRRSVGHGAPHADTAASRDRRRRTRQDGRGSGARARRTRMAHGRLQPHGERRDRHGVRRARPRLLVSPSSSGRSRPPRVVWLMVPAGRPVDDVLFGAGGLEEFLVEGDTIIDGGNSLYTDGPARAQRLAAKGVRFIDVGTSGGPAGARRGACLMIGGTRQDFRRLRPAVVRHRGGGRVPALPGHRRRPLREDGPQRHRVRHDAGDRRGVHGAASVQLLARPHGRRGRLQRTARSSSRAWWAGSRARSACTARTSKA